LDGAELFAARDQQSPSLSPSQIAHDLGISLNSINLEANAKDKKYYQEETKQTKFGQ